MNSSSFFLFPVMKVMGTLLAVDDYIFSLGSGFDAFEMGFRLRAAGFD
jgi:hypothetical protein